jgi:hypothetical protein
MINRQEKLDTLYTHLKKLQQEFIMWGATDMTMAEEIEEIMTDIQRLEDTLQLEKEVVDHIKNIKENK